MNYSNVYNALIEKRQTNPISCKDCYCEKHHIIPKSEGGSNEPSNLVYLTAREHYICHLLLARIYNDGKMWAALVFMSGYTNKHNRTYKFNSRLYESAKRNLAQSLKGIPLSKEHRMKLSISHKGKKLSEEQKRKISRSQLGRKCWLKGRHHSEETKRKISESERGCLPWNTGKHLSEEHKIKIGLKHKNKQVSLETRRKMSETKKRLYQSGKIQKRFGAKTNNGMKWYNDGVNSIMAFECPAGYVTGRIKTWK